MGAPLPSRVALAIAPQLERPALAGGPSFISIKRVRGVLTPVGGGAGYTVDADFIGDTATLDFEVTFAGPSQRYQLALAASDTAGDTLFRSMREVVASPGVTATVTETMSYVAPDTGVRTIFLAPADTMVLSGDTLAITATGIDATERTVTPLYIGWASRDPSVATVISSGPSSGRVIGGAIESPVWIVGRAFNGVADSVSLRVALRIASVVLATDTVHVLAGAVATTSVTVLDALGTPLERPVTFTSLDPTIATVAAVATPLAAAGRDAMRAAVAPQVVQVAGVKAGTTRLVASSGGKADTAVIVVDPGPVATIRMIPDSIALLPGDSARFSVVLLDAAGDTLRGRAVTWTTGNPQLTTVSASGTVSALATGRDVVTAAAEGVAASAIVNVVTTGTSVVRTVVSPKTLHLVSLGATGQLVAQGYAGDSSLVPGHYTWTVRQSLKLLSVDAVGGVTALAAGTAWVVATEKSGTADSAEVTVDLPVQLVGAASRGAVAPGAGSVPLRAGARVHPRSTPPVSGTPHAFGAGISAGPRSPKTPRPDANGHSMRVLRAHSRGG